MKLHNYVNLTFCWLCPVKFCWCSHLCALSWKLLYLSTLFMKWIRKVKLYLGMNVKCLSNDNYVCLILGLCLAPCTVQWHNYVIKVNTFRFRFKMTMTMTMTHILWGWNQYHRPGVLYLSTVVKTGDNTSVFPGGGIGFIAREFVRLHRPDCHEEVLSGKGKEMGSTIYSARWGCEYWNLYDH